MTQKFKDLRQEFQVRAALDELENDKMIVEGKAITYNDKTRLFTFDGQDYFEVIERGALEGADISDVFLKYNHSDNVMVLARTRNKTLELEDREDGLYIRAELADTTAGRDLYELIKRGDIDKMSFAFTENGYSYDEEERTWFVRSIKKLYDVAAVDIPAYENTTIYARRKDDLEKHLADLEKLEATKKRVLLLNNLGGKGK